MSDPRSAGFFLATCGVATLLASTAAVAAVLILRDGGEAAGSSVPVPTPERSGTPDAQLRDLTRTVQRLERELDQLQTQRGEEALASSPSSLDPRPGPRPPAGDSATQAPRQERSAGGGAFAGRLQELMSLRGADQREERLALARELAADPQSPGRGLALQILVELSPTEGLEQLRNIAQEPATEDGRRGPAGLWDRALTGLARAEGIDVEAELRSLYASGDRELQGATARALRQKGDDSLMKEFLSSLETSLNSSDSAVQLDALEQLSRNGGRENSELVLPLLADDDAEVRLRALGALSGGLDPSNIARIESLAQDPDERVRSRAGRMVESMRARQRMMEERARLRDGR